MTNPTQRFFTVEVTGCKNCPKAQRKDLQSMIKVCSDALYFEAERTHSENITKLTPSCPMFNQSHEVEK